MENILDGAPTRMIVLTGPSDTGKSALLRKVANEREFTIYVNLRETATVNVNSFVRAFNEAAGAVFLQIRSRVVDWLPVGGGENYTFRDKLSQVEFQKTLDCLSEALTQINHELSTREARGEKITRPLIIIDEFGSLLNIRQDAQEAQQILQSFLRWLMHASKEKQFAHVILGLTDSQVLENLQVFDANQVSNRIRFLCIGDFVPSEAKRYLQHKALQKGLDLSPEVIDRIYSVAGGRVLDLDCVSTYYLRVLVETFISFLCYFYINLFMLHHTFLVLYFLLAWAFLS